MLKIPYGVSYSCYYGYEEVSINTVEEAEKDGVISEEEALSTRILLNSNEILTNIFFNLGYMYNDVRQVID